MFLPHKPEQNEDNWGISEIPVTVGDSEDTWAEALMLSPNSPIYKTYMVPE